MYCTSGRSQHVLLKKNFKSNCCDNLPASYSVIKLCCNDNLVNKKECPSEIDCSPLSDLICQLLTLDELSLLASIIESGFTPIGICNYISAEQSNIDFTNLEECTGTIIVESPASGGQQPAITVRVIDGQLTCQVNDGFENLDITPPLTISFGSGDAINECVELIFFLILIKKL